MKPLKQHLPFGNPSAEAVAGGGGWGGRGRGGGGSGRGCSCSGLSLHALTSSSPGVVPKAFNHCGSSAPPPPPEQSRVVPPTGRPRLQSQGQALACPACQYRPVCAARMKVWAPHVACVNICKERLVFLPVHVGVHVSVGSHVCARLPDTEAHVCTMFPPVCPQGAGVKSERESCAHESGNVCSWAWVGTSVCAQTPEGHFSVYVTVWV